jgi:hypothetical protein
MNKDNLPKCFNCDFWIPDDELNKPPVFGCCRRFPPNIVDRLCFTHCFPKVKGDVWCAEYKIKTLEIRGNSF